MRRFLVRFSYQLHILIQNRKEKQRKKRVIHELTNFARFIFLRTCALLCSTMRDAGG